MLSVDLHALGAVRTIACETLCCVIRDSAMGVLHPFSSMLKIMLLLACNSALLDITRTLIVFVANAPQAVHPSWVVSLLVLQDVKRVLLGSSSVQTCCVTTVTDSVTTAGAMDQAATIVSNAVVLVHQTARVLWTVNICVQHIIQTMIRPKQSADLVILSVTLVDARDRCLRNAALGAKTLCFPTEHACKHAQPSHSGQTSHVLTHVVPVTLLVAVLAVTARRLFSARHVLP